MDDEDEEGHVGEEIEVGDGNQAHSTLFLLFLRQHADGSST